MKIRQLIAMDDRQSFTSGNPDLDSFFHRYAGQNQFRHHLGTTYVAVEENGKIAGFVTVSPGEVEVDRLPASLIKKFPGYPLPVLRLARLAVGVEQQARGIGSLLLQFVLELSVRLSTDYGCLGVVVDAKEDAVAFYERFGFIQLDLEEGASRGRPAPTCMFLAIRKIKEAIGKKR